MVARLPVKGMRALTLRPDRTTAAKKTLSCLQTRPYIGYRKAVIELKRQTLPAAPYRIEYPTIMIYHPPVKSNLFSSFSHILSSAHRFGQRMDFQAALRKRGRAAPAVYSGITTPHEERNAYDQKNRDPRYVRHL
jgi:hypothetical protein